jgi:hypothetical protein
MILVLHYILYAFHRFGVDQGPRYNRWRALAFFGVLEAWILVIIMGWLKVLLNIDMLSIPKWNFIVIAMPLAYINSLFWKSGQMKHEAIFDKWPIEKRDRWDIAVAVFSIFILVFLFYTATVVRPLFKNK